MIYWRLILEGVTTLQEIETHWSLNDILKANAILDLKKDLETAHYNRMQKDGNRNSKKLSH